MRIGYARVSTTKQDLARQERLLKQRGCELIIKEKVSGISKDRPELETLKKLVRPKDIIMIESWSRLGRSTKELIELVDYFKDKKVKIISLKENFDTSTPQGRFMMTMFQAFAEFERELIVERVNEGIQAAKAQGRHCGRPKKDERDIQHAMTLYKSKDYSISEIERQTGVSKSTLYRYLREEKERKEYKKES